MPNDRPKTTLPRCGDHVFHQPSGETWLVAWADDEHLAPNGWPPSVAQLSDCEVVRRCTDAEHEAAVRMWLNSTGGTRAKVLRLYGEVVGQ